MSTGTAKPLTLQDVQETLAVCADWLETHGHQARANHARIAASPFERYGPPWAVDAYVDSVEAHRDSHQGTVHYCWSIISDKPDRNVPLPATGEPVQITPRLDAERRLTFRYF
jgi:hypothetical protein